MDLTRFKIAAGSIVGRDHLRPLGWKNNQDSFAIRQTEHAIVAVVADGCGSEAKSEVGAVIGANLMAESLVGWAPSVAYIPNSNASAIHRSYGLLLDRLRVLVPWMADWKVVEGFRKTVYDHFLFTINGVLLMPEHTTFFCAGDGVQMINGDPIAMPPIENNAPPYPGYGLLSGNQTVLTITHQVMTEHVASLLIGTDGVDHMITKESVVGPISDFWTRDGYFQNPDAIRRRLALMNQEHVAINDDGAIARTPGHLPDDTTLVVIRRKPE